MLLTFQLVARNSRFTISRENYGKKKRKGTLKQKTQAKQAKPTLCDPDIRSYLAALHKRFVVATIDKAANNFAFI